MGYFRILAAIPGFFLSSLFFKLLWGAVAPKLGLVADILGQPENRVNSP